MAEQKPKRYISDIPELMTEWNWKKNDELGLDPTKITHASAKYVWWKCLKCDYEWQTPVYTRTRPIPHGCPECKAKKRVAKTIFEEYPDLLGEWNCDKNHTYAPQNVGYTSNKKIWWKCSYCSCEWQETIRHRIGNHINQKPYLGCKACRNLNKSIKKEGK